MLKVGLIGCGFMGTMHANCYKNIAGVELTALADVRPEKAAELAKGTNAKLYGDGMDLIREADVDVIDICLPTYLHAAYALAAMDKVNYVFVEKPVTLTAAEGDALLEKAAATGCRVQVGQVIRFWDEYVELAKYIREGTYGKVLNANFRRISPSPTWGWENWLHDVSKSGGAGQDLHIHDIDYVLSVFGAPTAFRTVKNRIGEKNAYVATLLEYPDFCVSTEGTWDLPGSHPFSATFRVVFEKAVAEYEGGVLKIYDDAGAHDVKIEKVQLSGGYKGGNVSDLGGYYNELLSFTDNAKAGKDVERATLAAGVASLKFVLNEIAD